MISRMVSVLAAGEMHNCLLNGLSVAIQALVLDAPSTILCAQACLYLVQLTSG